MCSSILESNIYLKLGKDYKYLSPQSWPELAQFIIISIFPCSMDCKGSWEMSEACISWPGPLTQKQTSMMTEIVKILSAICIIGEENM
jgi:hypothetical protein